MPVCIPFGFRQSYQLRPSESQSLHAFMQLSVILVSHSLFSNHPVPPIPSPLHLSPLTPHPSASPSPKFHLTPPPPRSPIPHHTMPPHPHPSPSALTRDRLARGQPPTPRPKPNPTKGAKSGLGDAGEGARSELWEMQERKRRAAEVLASWEMLAWFAGSRGEVCFLLSLLRNSFCFFSSPAKVGISSGIEYTPDTPALPETDDRARGAWCGGGVG